jgi:monofunctional biosynthetic peptidoglycan transglycosylase
MPPLPEVTSTRQSLWLALKQWLVLVLMGLLLLQLFFVGRVAFMALADPTSTAFERSQAWQIMAKQGHLTWRQEWRPADQISNTLKRAVLSSEDSAFTQHKGVWWDAIEKAWQKNVKAQAKIEAQAALQNKTKNKAPKIVGGSTITQQLAKNLFLSGERTLLRKTQEWVITMALESFLTKQQILTLYLNHVEWGQGVFGAEAAAQHYFQKPAAKLSEWEAARLAVMLPRPRFFEKLPQSAYLNERAQTIMARMNDVALPSKNQGN